MRAVFCSASCCDAVRCLDRGRRAAFTHLLSNAVGRSGSSASSSRSDCAASLEIVAAPEPSAGSRPSVRRRLAISSATPYTKFRRREMNAVSATATVRPPPTSTSDIVPVGPILLLAASDSPACTSSRTAATGSSPAVFSGSTAASTISCISIGSRPRSPSTGARAVAARSRRFSGTGDRSDRLAFSSGARSSSICAGSRWSSPYTNWTMLPAAVRTVLSYCTVRSSRHFIRRRCM
mmetsp:Transcript_9402/g.33063  ORF Transcript_9402/g.33063 Transcript_9402/m.33063 type:complete len:236 (-) Transcript_9402:1261-1968(-)